MVNLSDIFRSIFGPPKERLGTNNLPRDIQEDLENLYGRRPDPHWHSEPPTSHEQWRIFAEGHPPEQGDHEEYFQFGEGDFLQEFEQMFQSMFRGFSFDFNPPTQGLPTLDLPPESSSDIPQENFSSHSGSLRDRMLRGPESSLDSDNFKDQQNGNQSEGSPLFPPFSLFGDLWRLPFGGLSCPDERVDRDLDSEVKMGTHSLDDILTKKDDSQRPQQNPRFSSSSSFSSVTIVDSNGVTEKRTTRRDSSGKEEVTITRRIGDQTHTVTQRKDSCGNEETQVDIANNDKDGSTSSRQLTPLSSIYESVLEQFFPKRR
ncbi:hypothetical protein ACROYT_G001425 [Oculina patagonica]